MAFHLILSAMPQGFAEQISGEAPTDGTVVRRFRMVENIRCLADAKYSGNNKPNISEEFGVVGVITSAKGGDADHDAADIQANIDAVAAIGGGRVQLRFGSNYLIKTPLLMRKGVQLDGVCPTDIGDTTPPYLMCARLTAAADMSAVLTQANLNQPLHSIGLRNLVIDGNKVKFDVKNIVELSLINGRIENNTITNGSGGCVYIRANPTAAWINWIDGNTISRCDGIGFDFEGSDSRITSNYFSGSGENVLINTTGAYSFAENMVDNTSASFGGPAHLAPEIAGTASARIGLELRCSPLNVRHITSVVGNYFDQNGQADVLISKPKSLSSCSARSPIVGNIFHGTLATKTGGNLEIQPSISAGLVSGNVFSDSSPYNVVFDAATGNTGWSFVGNSFSRYPGAVSAPYKNLPSDATLLNNGDSGPSNRLQNLLIAAPASATDSTGARITAGSQLDVLGNHLVLGASGAIARFGITEHNAGYDTALLIGSDNGNTPYLDCVDGEMTTVVGCSIKYKHEVAVRISVNAIAMTKALQLPVLTSAPTAPAAGQASFFVKRFGRSCQLSVVNSAGSVSAIGASYACP